METLKILELFGGIGACSNALKRLNIPFEIVDYVEIDKYAVKSFNAIYGTNFEPQDITNWDKDVKVDLIFNGSPCQDFSLAGKQAGGDEGSGTRSSLMYETLRIVEKLRPKYVIWENVKNILSKKHKHNFDAYLNKMEQFGYTNYYQVLNAKDYGIPQNRERVFTISILGNENFEFPQKQELKLSLKNILEDEVNEKYYLSEIAINKLKRHNNAIINNNTPNISSTIHAGYYKMGGRDQQYIKENKIRRLTSKECWRLMGFDDEDFEKARQVNSDTQLYKQAGNSIVVNVLVEIFRNLFNLDKEVK